LADITVFVIDVAMGEEIPRKGGPAIKKSDVLVINKTDLAPYVGADLSVMQRDAASVREDRPYFFAEVRNNKNIKSIVDMLLELSGLPLALPD